MAESKQDSAKHRGFLSGGGALGELIAAFDWARTPLGPIEGWPQSLRTTVGLILRSPVPIVTLWGVDGVMIYNDAYSGFAAGRHPSLLGSKVREGWPEVADFNDNVMKVGLAGNTLAYRDQELLLNRHGVLEQVWMNLDYSPVIDDDGAPAGVMAIVVETSGKVRAEQALRASEAQFRTFAQAVPNHVWTSGPDGLLDWFNDRVYEFSGTSPGDLDGAAWARIVHPDDVAAAGASWAAALASGETYQTEFRLRRADGMFRWHLGRAVPLRDAEGNVLRWVGTNTDIEEHKGALDALAFLNETLEQQVAERTADRDRMWRLSADLLLVAREDSIITAVNPAWTTLLGWSERELIGRSYFKFIHPEDRPSTLAAGQRLSEGIPTVEVENRYRHKDGSLRTILWTVFPQEGLLHCVGRDVTAEREAAETLRRTEEALRQSQKMDAVGQLTGGIAHDFNNMLAVIMGGIDLAGRRLGGDPAVVQRYLAGAQEGAERAAQLTQRLLAFSRQQPLVPQVLSINRLVLQMSELLRRTLGETIHLETVLAGGLWLTSVDPHQLDNAIINLAVNGRDAMPGGGTLTIETANAHLDDGYALENPGVAAGQYVMISVTDSGSGIAPDMLEKVFDPFFTTKAVGKGTGLGLSMVYGFVRQSGGHIKIYSEVGHGTTVRIYLARRLGSEDEVRGRDVQDTALPAMAGEVVLLVEDDERVRKVSAAALSELGYRVHVAENGDRAIALLQTIGRIDLLFTDMVMPGMTGSQLAEIVGARFPDVKILFTTGYARNAAIHSGILGREVALLPKPFTVSALAAKVRATLDG